MKSFVIGLLAACSGHILFAQSRNNLYADLSINNPGASASYDRKLTKHLDIGAGASFNNFNGYLYHNTRFAAFADVRPFRVIKRNLFFAIADAGYVLYGGRVAPPDKEALGATGLYAGLGFGYGYRINKRGVAPYVSLCMNGGTERYLIHNPALTPRASDYTLFDADLVLSVGFKF